MKIYTYDTNNLQYKPVNYAITFLKIALIYLTLFLFLGLTNAPSKKEYITNTESIFLTGIFADCGSVLIYEPYMKIVGLVHAGWRGLSKEISKKAISEICRVFNAKPSNLLIGIGPHIKQCCYTVSQDVAKLFSQGFLKKTGNQKWNLSIENAIIKQLVDVGIEEKNIERSDYCTFCSEDMFFSYRRDKGVTGRMMAVIGMNK